MTTLLEQALREIERLPESEQDAVAGAIFEHLKHRGSSVLTDAQVAEVHRRITDPDRKFLSLEDVRARIARLRP
jgi:putative addiction module component (TIGR02574 family)